MMYTASDGKKYNLGSPTGATAFLKAHPDFATTQAQGLRKPNVPRENRRGVLAIWGNLGHVLHPSQLAAVGADQKKAMADLCAETLARVPRLQGFRQLDNNEDDEAVEMVIQWTKDLTFVTLALKEGGFFAQLAEIAEAAAQPSQEFVRQLLCCTLNASISLVCNSPDNTSGGGGGGSLVRLGKVKIAQAAARLLGRHPANDEITDTLLKCVVVAVGGGGGVVFTEDIDAYFA
jgi:hypothetical protein